MRVLKLWWRLAPGEEQRNQDGRNDAKELRGGPPLDGSALSCVAQATDDR
jgi:hypothetical protein